LSYSRRSSLSLFTDSDNLTSYVIGVVDGPPPKNAPGEYGAAYIDFEKGTTLMDVVPVAPLSDILSRIVHSNLISGNRTTVVPRKPTSSAFIDGYLRSIEIPTYVNEDDRALQAAYECARSAHSQRNQLWAYTLFRLVLGRRSDAPVTIRIANRLYSHYLALLNSRVEHSWLEDDISKTIFYLRSHRFGMGSMMDLKGVKAVMQSVPQCGPEFLIPSIITESRKIDFGNLVLPLVVGKDDPIHPYLFVRSRANSHISSEEERSDFLDLALETYIHGDDEI